MGPARSKCSAVLVPVLGALGMLYAALLNGTDLDTQVTGIGVLLLCFSYWAVWQLVLPKACQSMCSERNL